MRNILGLKIPEHMIMMKL